MPWEIPKKISLRAAAILFLFTFFTLILDAPRTVPYLLKSKIFFNTFVTCFHRSSIFVLGTPSPDFNSTRIGGLNTSGTIFPNPPSVLPSQANKLVPVPPPPPPSSHQQLHTLEHLVSDLRDQVPYVFTGVADQDPRGYALFWNPDPH